MGLLLLSCSLFLSVSVSHVIVCLSIDTPLYWFVLDLLFTTAFSVYAGFWLKFACIRGFLVKSHVHMWSCPDVLIGRINNVNKSYQVIR